jgi:hypothetical protein
MRWHVEVTSLGKAEKDSLYVDAESWQKALQSARTQRGEDGSMAGFSIELLVDGCRAVDSATRLTYLVQPASEAAARAAFGAPSAGPPRPASYTGGPRNSPSGPPPAVVLGALTPPVPIVMVGATPSPSRAPQPQPHASQVPQAQPYVAPSQVPQAQPYVAPSQVPQAQPYVAPSQVPQAPLPAPVRTELSSMVPSQIIFKREQDPSGSMPLTYREYVYAVPPGSSEAAAAMLMQRQLELVRSSLERSPPGKLVNLAVFDTTFQGKPPVPPLATLAWKDWRGAPVVAFPRRGTPYAGSTPPPAASQTPPAAPAPAPPAAIFPPDTAVYIAAPPTYVPDGAHAGVAEAPLAQPVAAPVPFPGLAPAQPAPTAAPFPGRAPAQPAAFPGAAAMQSPSQVPVQPTPSQAYAPVQAYVPPQPAGVEPPPARVASPASPWRQRPAPPVEQGHPPARASGEDLVAFLFESMHEVNFARDAVEGGAFCLGLAMEKLPSYAALVELYDINRREFLVTSTRGPVAADLLLRRFPESDPLLSLAMRRRRAVVVADATETEAATNERYVLLGGARSLIVAPVMVAGRFLGAIELVNPIDGQPFTESDGNAMTYMAEQFAEFVAARGVVTDPERITAAAQEARA